MYEEDDDEDADIDELLDEEFGSLAADDDPWLHNVDDATKPVPDWIPLNDLVG